MKKSSFIKLVSVVLVALMIATTLNPASSSAFQDSDGNWLYKEYVRGKKIDAAYISP